jgi:hypothetical protein
MEIIMNKVNRPNGYPFSLYRVSDDKKVRYVAAISTEDAIKKAGLAVVKDVDQALVSELVKKIGHSKANNVIKTFNPDWLTSMGRVYYKTTNLSGDINESKNRQL